MTSFALPNMPDTSPSLPDIEVLKLQITVKWRRPYSIPGHVIANVLRGAVAITFRRLVCPEQYFQDECLPCPLYAGCAYGQLFSPTPPSDATQLRLQQDLPRPFVLEPPGLDPDQRQPLDRLSFQLILFGSAADWLPFFITTIERLGWDGMGRDRMPFDIESVVAQHPAGNEMLFQKGETTLKLPQNRIQTSDLIAVLPRQEKTPFQTPLLTKAGLGGASESLDPTTTCRQTSEESINYPLRQRLQQRMGLTPIPAASAERLPGDSSRPRIMLHFRTPMLLKSGSYKDANGRIIPAREIRDRPPFGVIARRLRDRLSALCLFFTEKPWQHPDFAGLGQRADEVTLIHSDTVWLTRQRTSTRTGETHEISGFVGEAVYEFPTTESFHEFGPLLKLGEYLHIGKHAPWGNGAIAVSLLEGANT